MGKHFVILTLFFVSMSACAGLQNVELGGKIEIYGAWYSPSAEPKGSAARFSDESLLFRPIGIDGSNSALRLDGTGNTSSFFEQRTRLHVHGDFTDHVSSFIEYVFVDTWGNNFRSDYLTGQDIAAGTTGDTELHQAYIEVDQLADLPLRLRIGRQELEFGSGWMVGADHGPDPFVALSFDAIRLTWNAAPLTVDTWLSKIAPTQSPFEEDGDTDFYGLHLSFVESCDQTTDSHPPYTMLFPPHMLHHLLRQYTPLKNISPKQCDSILFDTYLLFIRDGKSQADTRLAPCYEWREDLFGLDNYDVTVFTTAGMRTAGTLGALDWELEGAYQWGNADAIGIRFKPVQGIYGDDDARYNTWAMHCDMGYTLGGRLAPRLHLGGAYYDGEDRRAITVWQWLNPLQRAHASISYNRLFSTWSEDAFIDASTMSNFWKVFLGTNIRLSEKVDIDTDITKLGVVEPFRCPMINSEYTPFLTRKSDSDLGWQTSIMATYTYGANLSFECGWSHWFTGKAIKDGAFIDERGMLNVGGRDNKDADYIYTLATLIF